MSKRENTRRRNTRRRHTRRRNTRRRNTVRRNTGRRNTVRRNTRRRNTRRRRRKGGARGDKDAHVKEMEALQARINELQASQPPEVEGEVRPGQPKVYFTHMTNCDSIKGEEECDNEPDCYYSRGKLGATTGCKKQFNFKEWSGPTPRRDTPKMVDPKNKKRPSNSKSRPKRSAEELELKALRKENEELRRQLNLSI